MGWYHSLTLLQVICLIRPPLTIDQVVAHWVQAHMVSVILNTYYMHSHTSQEAFQLGPLVKTALHFSSGDGPVSPTDGSDREPWPSPGKGPVPKPRRRSRSPYSTKGMSSCVCVCTCVCGGWENSYYDRPLGSVWIKRTSF